MGRLNGKRKMAEWESAEVWESAPGPAANEKPIVDRAKTAFSKAAQSPFGRFVGLTVPPVFNPFGALHGVSEITSAADRGAYEAGGNITDLAARIGLPPEVAAGAGFAGNVALQALPTLIGGEIAKAGTVPLKSFSKDWMSRALKPTLEQKKSGDAAVAIDTLLKKGINPTEGGVTKLKQMIGSLEDDISSLVQKSGAEVNRSDIVPAVKVTFDKFKNQVNRGADMNTLKSSWGEFLKTYFPGGRPTIPVQEAHRLKQGTYKMLGERPYLKELNPAATEAQMAIASGLREGVGKAVPDALPLLAEQQKLIQTLNVAERRALMDLNKNPGGLALLAHNPASFAAFMADKSTLFKSIVARMANAVAERPAIPQNIGRGTVSLYEMSRNPQEAQP